MPSPYIFRVNSRPTNTDERTWEKWYTEEHIPELIQNKASTRAALYREVYDIPWLYEYNLEKNPRNYLTVYQTDHKELLKSEGVKETRMTSELFPEKDIFKYGEFDERNYEMIHDFDPNGLGDTPAPYILYAELEPEDEEDLDAFYRKEHFPLLAKVPGYRKGVRYKLGPTTSRTMGSPPKFLALHELETSHEMMHSQEMVDVTTSDWTKKTMATVKFAEIRSFELVKAFGY